MLFAFLSGFKFLTTHVEGDVTDRLHYYMTSNLMIALAILVSWKQFGGHPIECMVPETFVGPWEEYAENYCWAESTYYVPFVLGVLDDQERINRQINYYQWVPFYLLLSAITFQIPCLFWKFMAGHSGLKIHDLVDESSDRKNLAPLVRQETIRMLTVHIENALRFHRRTIKRQFTPHAIFRIFNLPYTAVYVTACYLTMKLMYLINVIAQFYLMNLFLETSDYSFFGFGTLKAILNGTEWEQSGIFPRVTMCDLKTRTMGNIQRHSFQCVLTINLFNEKIFMFLWVWFWVLFFLSLFSMTYWSIVTLCPCSVQRFINRHLSLSEIVIDTRACQLDIRRFISKYLRVDGIFVLRMVTIHAGVIFGTDLVANLYRSFYGIEGTKLINKEDEKTQLWGIEKHLDKVHSAPTTPPKSPQQHGQSVDYEHCPEQNELNDIAMQLAHLRRRSASLASQLEGDSRRQFMTSLGEMLTIPRQLQISATPIAGMDRYGNIQQAFGLTTKRAAPFAPNPLFEPKFAASKRAKKVARAKMREEEEKLRKVEDGDDEEEVTNMA